MMGELIKVASRFSHLDDLLSGEHISPHSSMNSHPIALHHHPSYAHDRVGSRVARVKLQRMGTALRLG